MAKKRIVAFARFAGACVLVIGIMHTKRHRTISADEVIPLTSIASIAAETPQTPRKPHAAYTKNCVHNDVTFYAHKDDQSNEMIARKGLLTLRKNAKGTVLICHGYMCNKDDVIFLRTLFPQYNCMVFDFRAHGDIRSDQYCTLGKHESFDVIAAAQFLRAHPKLKNSKLFGYGFSMGAASLIEAQAKMPLFDALILDCPFDSSASVLDRVLAKLQVTVCGYSFDMPGRALLQKYAFHPYVEPLMRGLVKSVAYVDHIDINTQLADVSPEHAVKKINVPCYFIHCKNDEKISVAAAKKLYNNVNSDFKRLWLTEGRRHFDSFFYNPEKYAYRTNKFLERVLSKSFVTYPAEKIYDDNEPITERHENERLS